MAACTALRRTRYSSTKRLLLSFISRRFCPVVSFVTGRPCGPGAARDAQAAAAPVDRVDLDLDQPARLHAFQIGADAAARQDAGPADDVAPCRAGTAGMLLDHGQQHPVAPRRGQLDWDS